MNKTDNNVFEGLEAYSETDNKPEQVEIDIPYNKNELLFVLGLIGGMRAKN